MKKWIIILPIIFLSSFSTQVVFSESDEEKRQQLQEQIIVLQELLETLLEQKRQLDESKKTSFAKKSYADFSYILSPGLHDAIADNEVSVLQKLLITDGYLDDIVDGIFGSKTAAAVEKMKQAAGIQQKKYGEFNAADLHTASTHTQDYSIKKMNRFLGSDQVDFYSIPFPFSVSTLENVQCNGAVVPHILKNNEIIFPISFPYDSQVQKVSCVLHTKFEKNTYPVIDLYRKEVSRKTVHITLNSRATTTYIAPVQSDIDRAAAERKLTAEIHQHSSKKPLFNTAFVHPTNSIITSPFGVTRIFNNARKSYHNGTDFRAAVGAPIRSVNSGKVVLAQDLFYCGNTIIIDHGMGLFSTYCHLSQFNVSKGELVTQGQLLGLGGATGRVSGPHLHLSIQHVNNGVVQYIDFLDMIERSQALQ